MVSETQDSSEASSEENGFKTTGTVLLGDSASTSRRGSTDSGIPCPADMAVLWVNRLGVQRQDSIEAEIMKVSLDEPNQRVIRYDCERTRGTVEEFKQPENREMIERLLTFYCKSHSLAYKQGMNEVLAPFVALKLWNGIETWGEVYLMYKGFIDLFLPNMFCDEEFQFLQKCCALFRTCLRYHAPSLSSRLDAANVTPEMYVTPWFLTLFSSKTSLTAVLQLWHYLLTGGDKHSFIFVAISLCLSHARLLRAAAKVSLPETITKITIGEDSVESVWKRALKVRQHTPPFFIQQLVNAAEWDVLDAITAPHLQKQLGDVYPMTVRPMDLFRHRSPNDGWKYVVLDCRPDWLIASGRIGSLPLSIPFDLDSLVTGQNVFPVAEALQRVGDLLSVDITETVPQWPIENHICIMGLSDSVIDATGLLYVALAKFSNVPRVSLLKGGFASVHREAPQELIDHDYAGCPLCNNVPITSILEKPISRPRAGSSASSVDDSSGTSSPVSTNGGGNGFFQRLKTFVSDSSSAVASGTNSMLGVGGSRFIIGTVPPLPTSKATFAPGKEQLVQKCQLVEVLGRQPSSDLEANALLVVSPDFVKCFAAPLDMTLLTGKCDLKSYGVWKMSDVCKITSRGGQGDTLMLYFSVESAPDLVVTMLNSTVAKSVVEDIRHKFRRCKKANS
jgi:hypothetical protein